MVVRTADCDLPDGVHVADDRGPANIHRWWTVGIAAATRARARYVAVANDDVTITEQTLPLMLDAMHREQSPLCWATDRDGAITGWFWLVRVASPVRPDQSYRWWWGDVDLDLQARQCGGASRVEVGVVHLHGNEATLASPQLRALADADQGTYHAKWSRR